MPMWGAGLTLKLARDINRLIIDRKGRSPVAALSSFISVRKPSSVEKSRACWSGKNRVKNSFASSARSRRIPACVTNGPGSSASLRAWAMHRLAATMHSSTSSCDVFFCTSSMRSICLFSLSNQRCSGRCSMTSSRDSLQVRRAL